MTSRIYMIARIVRTSIIVNIVKSKFCRIWIWVSSMISMTARIVLGLPGATWCGRMWKGLFSPPGLARFSSSIKGFVWRYNMFGASYMFLVHPGSFSISFDQIILGIKTLEVQSYKQEDQQPQWCPHGHHWTEDSIIFQFIIFVAKFRKQWIKNPLLKS